MTRLSSLLVLSLGLALTACSDKDDEDDDAGGSADVDSDGDGLMDAEEDELGTDPDSVDSDGDTYWDGWEVTEDTDPLDEDERIYTGYWPYQPDKASFGASDWDNFGAEEDDYMPSTILMDQWGEEVDIHDFAGQDRYIMMDISAMWCGPCNGMSSWLSGGSDSYGFGSYWPEILELVEGEHIYWVTVMVQDYYGAVPELDDLEEWYDMYTDPWVPVLGDQELWYGVAPAYPSMYLFTPDMELVQGPGNVNHYKPLDDLADMADDIIEGHEESADEE